MPELPPTILNFRLISKSPTLPPRQMRNVFWLSGFSAVVVPVIAPSLTDHAHSKPGTARRNFAKSTR